MSKVTKTKSGKWHTYIYDYTDVNGKRHVKSITADTKAEVQYLAAQFKKDKKGKIALKDTVGGVIDKYINEYTDTLSPSTLSAYKKVRAYAFQDLMGMEVEALTDEVINEAIRKECKRKNVQNGKPLSPKTIKNEYGLVASALKQICKLSFDVKLPKVQRQNKTLPEPEDVMRAVMGTDVELPCLLAMWLSFSLSEIRGLKCSSIHGDYIHIDQVMVTVDNEPIVKKEAKTSTRIRKQLLPKYIKDLILNSEQYQDYLKTGNDRFLIEMSGEKLRHHYHNVLDKAGLDLRFHDLRHLFASVMLSKLNIPLRLVQDEGGWSSPKILTTVYSNSFDSSRLEADRIRDTYFESLMNIQ